MARSEECVAQCDIRTCVGTRGRSPPGWGGQAPEAALGPPRAARSHPAPRAAPAAPAASLPAADHPSCFISLLWPITMSSRAAAGTLSKLGAGGKCDARALTATPDLSPRRPAEPLEPDAGPQRRDASQIPWSTRDRKQAPPGRERAPLRHNKIPTIKAGAASKGAVETAEIGPPISTYPAGSFQLLNTTSRPVPVHLTFVTGCFGGAAPGLKVSELTRWRAWPLRRPWTMAKRKLSQWEL